MEERKYSWSCSDVLTLLGIQHNTGKEENEIPCPFCGGKKFAMNIRMDTGHCWNCQQGADSVGYYSVVMGMGLNDARNDIRRRLELPDEKTGKLPERFVFVEKPEQPIAPIEVRDKVYRAFLEELKLSDKHRESLLARGFTNEDIERLMYRSYPDPSKYDYKSICNRLRNKGISLKGVPGFFTLRNGDWVIPKYTLGIIVPQINIHNQIHGLQIRKDDDLRRVIDGELESKYGWFSTRGYLNGSKITTSVHIASDFIWNKEKSEYEPLLHGGVITVTEGGMKGDLTNALLEQRCSVAAVQGVHALNPLKDTLTSLIPYGLKKVNLAFDMDYLTNPNVQKAMKATEEMIKSLGLEYENIMNWQYECQDENGVFYLKGIDDYFAYYQKGIRPIAKALIAEDNK